MVWYLHKIHTIDRIDNRTLMILEIKEISKMCNNLFIILKYFLKGDMKIIETYYYTSFYNEN